MAVAADKPVAVTNVDDVAVAALASGKDHDAVAHSSHRCSHCRCVVSALVLSPDAEHRMPAAAEDAGDPAKRDRSAQERGTQRLAGSIEVLPARRTTVEANRLDL